MAGDIRTLVVEDIPDIRVNITVRLKLAEGFTLIGEAHDGQEAIALATDLQPDLVLLDVMMPVMSGDQALPHIRDAAPRAVVVYLSVLDDWQIEGWDPERPAADGVMSKPQFLAHTNDALTELRTLVEGRR